MQVLLPNVFFFFFWNWLFLDYTNSFHSSRDCVFSMKLWLAIFFNTQSQGQKFDPNLLKVYWSLGIIFYFLVDNSFCNLYLTLYGGQKSNFIG